MDEKTLQSRLSRISTIWTALGAAHGVGDSRAADAQAALIQRYQGAVYRYLLGALHDEDAADDLFQEFALKMSQGAFRRADPGRGRFRDYLKTTLCHLVTDYHNRRRKERPADGDCMPEPAVLPDGSSAEDERFFQSWREELLARVWASLEQSQERGGQPYYSVLRFRSENPDASSAEMAAELSRQLKPEKPFTETGIRKTLQRAKMQFADLLIEDVAQTLDNPTVEELEQELIDLGLLGYCRSAVGRWKHKGTDEGSGTRDER
jgi:RNA polymerase sigma factor (sigma-70 family)